MTIFKGAFVAIVIGTALTFVNYGDVIKDPDALPSWWKVVLNFIVPFLAEVLLCLFLSCFLNTEPEELLLHTTKQTAEFSNALPEIKVHSKPIHCSKITNSSPLDLHQPLKPYHSRRHESCPVFDFPQSPFFGSDSAALLRNEGCVRTHRNGLSIYTVNELPESEDLTSIQPLPKEGVKLKFSKCKSMSCLSDLASSSSRRTRKLQVFDNYLFFPDNELK
eukprot:g6747.t1